MNIELGRIHLISFMYVELIIRYFIALECYVDIVLLLYVPDLPRTLYKKKQLDSNTFTLSAEQYPCVIHWRCNIVWVSHVYVFHWYHHVIPIKALGKFAVYFISFAISPLILFILVWHTIWDFDTHLIKLFKYHFTSKVASV